MDNIIANIDGDLTEFISLLDELDDSTLIPSLKNEEDEIKYRKLYGSLALIVYSLKFVQLKLNGINPQNHLISNEMDRIRKYTVETTDLQNKINRVKIDKEAVERMIKFNTQNG